MPAQGESAKHEEVVVFASGFKCHIGGLHRSVARAFGAVRISQVGYARVEANVLARSLVLV